MPQREHHELAQRIHASGRRCVLGVTGGGSQAIADLFAVPGASASMLEAIVPYALTALEDWLGGAVDQACCEATARAMAMAAFERARELSDADPATFVGIGVTASLVSLQPKRGSHRVHIAWQTSAATVAYTCELVKGLRSRGEEEAVVSQLVLEATAEACGVANAKPTSPSAEEPIERREKAAPTEWTELLLGKRRSVTVGDAEAFPPRVVFPGRFRPLHAGHHKMIEIAAARCNAPVVLELSITNVDKPTLDFLEVDDRLRQLAAHPVALTRAPTFEEKAAIFPGATFVVGADTIERLAETRYYGESVARRDNALVSICAHECRFLVFGRRVGNEFQTLVDLDLPAALRQICEEVPAADFREDISSTELRSRG